MPTSLQPHSTQITGLPGEPGASAQNRPPSVGQRETPGEGVRERSLGTAGQGSREAEGRPREEEPKKGEGRRQPGLGGGWDTWVWPKNKHGAALGLPVLFVPDLPGTLGEGAYLLEHWPQPAGDSWTKTPFPWVSPNDLRNPGNTFGQAALESTQDPAPHHTTMTITSLLDQVT